MSNAVFPHFVGLKWGRKRSPVFANLGQVAISGRRASAALWPYPKWRWELSYEVLRSAVAYGELQSLLGFFLARQGSHDSFLFLDWEDYAVSGQAIGTGNGSQKVWQLVRTYGGFTEPVYDIKLTSPVPAVYVAGQLQESGYTVGSTGLLTFASAPTNGAAVTATFQYYWRCHFLQDETEFSAFMYRLWECRKLEFETDWT